MCPEQAVVRPINVPGVEMLATNDWTEEPGLDASSTAVGRGHRRRSRFVERFPCEHEGEIESRLHAEVRAPDATVSEWHAGGAETIKGVSHFRREYQPRAAQRVVEGETATRQAPAHRATAAMMRCRDQLARTIVGSAAPPFGNDEGRIYGRVEGRWCLGEILNLENAGLLTEQPPNATAR
jgi:hypothetical protein